MKSILLLFLMLTSFNALAENCNFWRIGFPDPIHRREAIDCQEIAEPLPPQTQLYVVEELSRDARISPLISAANESLNHSYDTYSVLGALPPMKVILYNQPYFNDSGTDTTYAFAFVNLYQADEACPILIYPAALDFDIAKFKQLLAHEVFHCFQMKNLEAQTRFATHHENYAWWLEGSAQFMSNVVYPNIDFEYDSMFGRYNPSNPLTQQASIYKTVYFFQALNNHAGARSHSVFEFLQLTPSSESSQEAAVQSFPDIDNIFHKFAREFSEGKIRDNSGRFAPTPSVAKTPMAIGLEDNQEREFVVQSYTVTNYQLQIREKGEYRLQASLPAGIKVSVKGANLADWTELPATIISDCDGITNVDLVISKVSSDADIDSANITFTRTEREDCGCEITGPPTHSCLFGEWELDHSTMRSFFESYFARVPNMRFISSSGGYRVRFDPSGVITWTNSFLIIDLEMSLGRNRVMQAQQIINGTANAIYQNRGQHRMCSADLTQNFTCFLTYTVQGHSRTVACANPVPVMPVEFGYDCNESTLLYKGPVTDDGGGIPFNYIFNRVR